MVRLALKIPPSALAAFPAAGRPLRLLYVVNDPAFFVSHRLILAHAAREAGFEVAVVAPLGPGEERIGDAGFRLIPLEMSRWGMNPFEEQRIIRRLVRIYGEEKPDIVHHIAMKAVIYGSLAARISGVPAVVNALCGLGYLFAGHDLRRRVGRLMACRLMRAAFAPARHRLIVQNEEDLNVLVGAGIAARSRSVVIPGAGVDVNEYRPRPRQGDVPLVLFAARMLADKGARDFVEAARILRERGVSARFVMAGAFVDGHPSSIGRETVASWRESGLVEIWGERSDMPHVLARASVMCLPSFYGEGVPRVLIEAASCGRPIVTTDTPGCRSIVRDGVNGLLVPPKDPPALAAALERVLSDPELAREMGEKGRRRVIEEGYSDRDVIRATFETYEELIGTEGGRPGLRSFSEGGGSAQRR